MTTAHAPLAPDGAPARGGATFRRWRRGRPFWGGLFLILSAVELFFSSNLNPSSFQVHFGPTGFLSYVIPAMLVLCGALTWLSPGQRLFYGILGTLTAVYSLIGLNLGGFFVGLLLGIVGGALTVAWSPARAASPPEPPDPPAEFDETQVGQRTTAVYGTPRDESSSEPEIEPVAGPRHGLLTDTLPTSLRSPLHEDGRPADGTGHYGGRHTTGGAGSAEDQRPPDGPGPLPQRRMRHAGGAFAILVLVAVAAAVVNPPQAAWAAPCPTSTKASTAKSSGAPAVAPNAAGAAKTSGSASASATASAQANDKAATSGGGVVQGIVDFFTGLFGGKKAAPAPADSASATPSPEPTAGPSTTTGAPATTTPAPTKSSAKPCTPSASASGSATAKRAAAAAGQPAVAVQPSLLVARVQTMSGLSYDGIVDLPTKTSSGPGTIRVLKFSMQTSVSRPFELRTPGGPKTLETKSSELTVAGNVAFYTNRFSGNLIGVIPQLYTPESPPFLIVPEVLFTDVEIQLVFVQADELTGPSLDIRYAA